jgi:hypothetical protein
MTTRLYLAEYLLLRGRHGEALPLLEEAREYYATNYPAPGRLRIRAEELAARPRGRAAPGG